MPAYTGRLPGTNASYSAIYGSNLKVACGTLASFLRISQPPTRLGSPWQNQDMRHPGWRQDHRAPGTRPPPLKHRRTHPHSLSRIFRRLQHQKTRQTLPELQHTQQIHRKTGPIKRHSNEYALKHFATFPTYHIVTRHLRRYTTPQSPHPLRL